MRRASSRIRPPRRVVRFPATGDLVIPRSEATRNLSASADSPRSPARVDEHVYLRGSELQLRHKRPKPKWALAPEANFPRCRFHTWVFPHLKSQISNLRLLFALSQRCEIKILRGSELQLRHKRPKPGWALAPEANFPRCRFHTWVFPPPEISNFKSAIAFCPLAAV